MAVMGKASAPGRTKTRLVPPFSAVEAAELNTAFLQDSIGNLLRAGRETEIAPYVAFGPAGAEPFFRDCLPANLPLIECCLPHFGDCLELATTHLLNLGHVSACVLNADSPTLPTGLLVQAARSLAEPGDGVVIGPSTDGGYYLLGVKRAHRRLFDDIDWSTPCVFEQTYERATELGLRITVLDPWYDVDDTAGLKSLYADLGAGDRPSRARIYEAPHTRATLARLTGDADGRSAASVAACGDL